MLTYNEIRELILAGELQAAANLLLAHRLVSSVEVQGENLMAGPNCTLFVENVGVSTARIEISCNQDGSPAVNVFTTLVAVPEDAVDPNTGKSIIPDGTDASLTEMVLEVLQMEGIRPISVAVSDYPETSYIIHTNLGPVSFDFLDTRSPRDIVEEFLEEGALSPLYQEYVLDMLEGRGVDVESMTQEELDSVCMSFCTR